ncbi:MAG: carotenoid biosynthesis protein, partial [Chloroflexota bacterium]
TFLGWAAEFIGTQTGLPFGVYHYTEKLQPQIGHVPLLIPIAWFMMLPVSWGLAQQLFYTINASAKGENENENENEGKSATSPFRQRLIIAVISAVYMTAWDLFLDPQMVAWDFWVWESPGQINYFGIPLLNYAGWLLVSFLMTWLINPPDLRVIYPQLWLMYAIVWFLETFGLLLFWGLAGPAIVGGIVMGSLLFLPVLLQFNANRRTNVEFQFSQLNQ